MVFLCCGTHYFFNSTTVYFDRLFFVSRHFVSCGSHNYAKKRDLHSDATLIGILWIAADNDTKCFKYINV